MAKKQMTRSQAFETVAKSLREFGYPDATAKMVSDTYDAMDAKKKLPHGIVGMFAESQLKEVWGALKAMAP